MSDVQYNDDGDYILGYVSIKIPNEFVRETVIETAYLNDMGTDKWQTFLSHDVYSE